MLDSSKKVKHLIDGAVALPDASPTSIVAAVIDYAEEMMAADVAANRAIGMHGAAAMLAAAKAVGRGVGGKLRVLTHCNTGSLATAAYGTALGCIRALRDNGQLEHAYCTETRCVLSRHICTAVDSSSCPTYQRVVMAGIPACLIVTI